MATDQAAAQGECAFARPLGTGSATQMERMCGRMHIFVQECARLAHGVLAVHGFLSGCGNRPPARQPARPADVARGGFDIRYCAIVRSKFKLSDGTIEASPEKMHSRHWASAEDVTRT